MDGENVVKESKMGNEFQKFERLWLQTSLEYCVSAKIAPELSVQISTLRQMVNRWKNDHDLIQFSKEIIVQGILKF